MVDGGHFRIIIMSSEMVVNRTIKLPYKGNKLTYFPSIYGQAIV